MPAFLTRLLIVVSCALLPPVLALADNFNLPDLGDESAALMSPYEEKKLGEEFMRNIHHYMDVVEDPELNAYIEGMGMRLAAHSDNPSQNFHFFIVNDPTINAFAVPGYVGVHTGLILSAKHEEEVAAVMAHEIAHVTQRHLQRMAAEDKRAAGPAMAALIAAILLSGASPAGGQALAALATGAYAQNQLSFGRSFEQEADRIGIATLARAGYDPEAMPIFFERLQSWSRLNETDLPEFLRTHPITAERISESRDRADRYTSHPKTDDMSFYEAQARIQALSKGNPKEILAIFDKTREEGSRERGVAAEYGHALVLMHNHQSEAAQKEASALAKRFPNRLSYQMLLADIALDMGKPAETLNIYRRALEKYPKARVLNRRYADALLQTGQPAKAREVLRALVQQKPDDPALYKMLARAAGDTGALVEAHQAMAEHYYLNGNPDAAIEQLHIALRFAHHNYYQTASVDARMKEIKDEVAQWRKQGK